jgi:hypothetical protein
MRGLQRGRKGASGSDPAGLTPYALTLNRFPLRLRSRKPSAARLSGIFPLLMGVKTPDLHAPTFLLCRAIHDFGEDTSVDRTTTVGPHVRGPSVDGILLLTAKVGA